MNMMNKLVKWLNKLGFYTKEQYDHVKKLNNEYIGIIKKHRGREMTDQIYINKLKDQIRLQPFQFDYLLMKYLKNQVNAFVYKIVNRVRNNPDERDLLDIWISRMQNAKQSLGEDIGDQPISIKDKVTPTSFPGY